MANEKRLISRYQLEQARHRGNNVYGYFNAYCHLNSSCDGCNRWVRLLCKLKSKIEDLQTEIILSVCKENNNGK